MLFVENNILFSIVIIVSAQIPIIVRKFIRNRKVRDICKISGIIILITGIIILLGCYGRNTYIESIKTANNEDIDTERYKPFQSTSDLAVLDEDSTLLLYDDLPVINGSASLFKLYASIINMVYPEDAGELNEEGSAFRYTGENQAIWEVIQGKTDIAFSDELSGYQILMAKALGKELVKIPICKDGFAFMVYGGNPVENISIDKIRKIYSGQIKNWNEIGGKDMEIIPYQYNDDNSAQSRMKKLMGNIDMINAIKKYKFNAGKGIEESVCTYSNEEGAIGYSFLHNLYGIESDIGTKILKVEDVYPDKESISKGSYPLSNYIYCIVEKNNKSKNVDKLLNWIKSAQGQYLIEKSGYIPLK